MTDFSDTQAGGIHDSNHGFLLDIRNGVNEIEGVLKRRNKWQIRIEPAKRELSVIPWLVKDINGEKTKLGNGSINGTVGKITFLLQPADKTAQFIPRDIFGLFMKYIGEIIKICTDVSAVTFHGMVSQPA